MRQLVVVVGFSGAGKSSVVRELSRNPTWASFDLDCEIEQRTGKTIEEVIRVEGESRFRALETEVLGDCVGKARQVQGDVAIAAGGGVLLREENRRLLKENGAELILLSVSEEVVVERIEQEHKAAESTGKKSGVRPLLTPKTSGETLHDRVRTLMRERQDLYRSIPKRVSSDFASVRTIAGVIEKEIARDAEKAVRNSWTVFPTSADSSELGDSEVVVGEGVLKSLGARIDKLFPKSTRWAVIVDQGVRLKWEAQLKEALGEKAVFFEVQSGESAKSLTELERIGDELLASGILRSDVIVGVGGGVVGDLAGLLASLFMRGIGLVHVATTIVAQVDSAIGGKTGVNLRGGKNTLGTFYPARLVMSELGFLSTLPDREYRSGFAEVVKYGLIASADFLEWIEKEVESLIRRDFSALREVVEFSTKTKLSIVGSDLTDRSGKRIHLNFGHTVGHALERLTGYSSLLHGEAVAIGMVVALRIGERVGVTNLGTAERVVKLLQKFGLPDAVPSGVGSRSDWMSALSADKKRESKGVSFVLVEGCGKAVTREIDLKEIVEAVS